MEELYPVSDPHIDQLVGAVMELVTSHWSDFFSTPKTERLGDEATWDALLPITLVDLGIEPSKAQRLCEIAKLEAQFS